MTCLVSRTGRELQRYNNMGRRQVVGCIPYRYKNIENNNNGDDSSNCNISSNINELEVLVISSQKGQGRFMFPKGGWEVDESLEEAASRESHEEAGVLGKVQLELGKWSFISKRHNTYYEGYMFPLLVNEQLDFWPEKNLRRRIWMSVTEAREVCQHWWMKEALDILVERLSSSSSSSSSCPCPIDEEVIVHQNQHQHHEQDIIISSNNNNDEDHVLALACALS